MRTLPFLRLAALALVLLSGAFSHDVEAQDETRLLSVEEGFQYLEDTFSAFRMIRNDFPRDYADIKFAMDALSKSGRVRVQDVSLAFSIAMAKLRSKYAPRLLYARDTDLQAIIDANVNILTVLNNDFGAGICAEFFLQGPAAFLTHKELFRAIASEADGAATAFLSAVSRSISDPIKRESTQDSDWEELGSMMEENGIPDEYFAVIESPDPRGDNVCPAFIAFLQSVNHMPSPAGERLRAEIVSSSF